METVEYFPEEINLWFAAGGTTETLCVSDLLLRVGILDYFLKREGNGERLTEWANDLCGVFIGDRQ